MRKTNTLINNITVTELKNHYLICKKKKLFNFGSLRRNPCVRVTVKHPCNAGLSYNKAVFCYLIKIKIFFEKLIY
jgi:hypothetical protein